MVVVCDGSDAAARRARAHVVAQEGIIEVRERPAQRFRCVHMYYALYYALTVEFLVIYRFLCSVTVNVTVSYA